MFSPFYAQNKMVNRSSSFFQLFVKDDIWPRCSLKRSYSTRVIRTFDQSESHFRSFALKKRAIHTKTKDRFLNPVFGTEMIHIWDRQSFKNLNFKLLTEAELYSSVIQFKHFLYTYFTPKCRVVFSFMNELLASSSHTWDISLRKRIKICHRNDNKIRRLIPPGFTLYNIENVICFFKLIKQQREQRDTSVKCVGGAHIAYILNARLKFLKKCEDRHEQCGKTRKCEGRKNKRRE